MSHRAAIYTVRVHKRGKHKPPNHPLGDYDGAGTSLCDTFNDFLVSSFSATNDEGDRSIVCDSSRVTGADEVHAMFRHGQTGLVAEIRDNQGGLRLMQDPNDTQLVRCASVFRLLRAESIGFWAVHVNNRRSAKALIEKGLQEKFRVKHDDLTLKILPCVNDAALMEAVSSGRIDSVRLSRLEKPSDRAVAATDKWVDGNDAGTLELKIRGHANWLRSERLKKFFKGDSAAHQDILEFDGMTFDEAKIEVQLANGNTRLFNIEKPDAGHAYSCDLEDLTVVNGEPTEDSLHEALAAVIDDLD